MEKQDNIGGDERMQVYEIGFHIVPIVSVDALPAEVHAIRSLIESNGGAIISEGAPQNRGLAYEISRMRGGKRERFDNAFFGWVKFEAAPEAISIVKTAFDKNENILRYLIIKTVRENTMAQLRTSPRSANGDEEAERPVSAAPEVKTEAKTEPKSAAKSPSAEENSKMSDQEIDKTIDDMVKE